MGLDTSVHLSDCAEGAFRTYEDGYLDPVLRGGSTDLEVYDAIHLRPIVNSGDKILNWSKSANLKMLLQTVRILSESVGKLPKSAQTERTRLAVVVSLFLELYLLLLEKKQQFVVCNFRPIQDLVFPAKCHGTLI